MKNYLLKLSRYFTLSLALVFMFSCGEDEEGEGNSANIVGTWSVNSTDFSFLVDGTDIVDWFTTNGDFSQEEAQQLEDFFATLFDQEFTGTMEFTADNNYSANFGGESESGSYSVNGDVLTIDPSSEDAFQATIIELTNNSMILEFSEEDTDDLNDDGTNETLLVNITLNMSK